jgi:hypothetical protein
MEGTADREQLYSDFSEVPSEAAAESSDMGQLLSIPLTEGADDKSTAKHDKGKSAKPVKKPKKVKVNKIVTLPSGLACVRARGCGHLMHPSYEQLDWSHCPTCEMKHQIHHLAGRQVVIAQWVAEEEEQNTDPDVTTSDILKAARQYYVDEDAQDQYGKKDAKWGFRKALAFSLITKFEAAAELEQEWEERNKSAGLADERPWEGHTATEAIKAFEEAREKKAFDYVEETTANAAHRKALRQQAELAEDNGDLSTSPITEPQMLLDGQKRQVRPDVKVKWNEDVYVRADADIDVVRHLSSMKLDPHKTKTPMRSILRANADVPPTGPLSSPSAPEPVTSHEVIKLADDTVDSSCLRKRSREYHQVGRWSIDEDGRTNVNTSFSNFFVSQTNYTEPYWNKMKKYVDELHEEVGEGPGEILFEEVSEEESDEESDEESEYEWEDEEEDSSDEDDSEEETAEEEEPVGDHPSQEDQETRDLTTYLEKILDWEVDYERIDPMTNEEGVLCYWVLWKGCTMPMWCPYYSLADCGRVLEEFQQKHPEIPMPRGDSDDEEEDMEEGKESDEEETVEEGKESDEDVIARAEQQMLEARMANLPRPGNLETIEEDSEEEIGVPIAEL